MKDVDRFKLKAFIDELKKYSTPHTELVSVYIPQGYSLNNILDHLYEEQHTATNIKSATTRKNVIDALERMIQYLRKIPKTPPNGLAIFSGNILAHEGKSDVRVWAIEPPMPIKSRIYRCDKRFVLQPLEEMLADNTTYGLVVMDKREATIGLLRGKAIQVLKQLESDIPGKSRAGGQSAQRFARLREGATKEFFKKIAEEMKNQYLPILQDIKGIILGGPGPTKYDFYNGNYILENIKQKILAVKDISYTDESGLYELLNASKDILQNEELMQEKQMMQRFLELLAKNPDKVDYGYNIVRQRLQEGRVDVLLISEALESEKANELIELAKLTNPEIFIISTDIPEGVQLKELGKVAAILRY